MNSSILGVNGERAKVNIHGCMHKDANATRAQEGSKYTIHYTALGQEQVGRSTCAQANELLATSDICVLKQCTFHCVLLFYIRELNQR
ncbi:hypothetical protein L798_01137 [Zootermopsis nevadensis]|uniref:Uncharacterized protein n=1 Tax=Zootermopsis nevadensis TaxID=136037 RepID=A0A067QWZ4_ZOONE|nr:hypothetical protein L798_01137 [Zootermopsis nevadensis]